MVPQGSYPLEKFFRTNSVHTDQQWKGDISKEEKENNTVPVMFHNVNGLALNSP